jgi:predicted nucleic acid-binding protein
VILLDTSAIYALADTADPNHARALTLFRQALDDRESFLVHSYILVESASLLQHRLGLASAVRFLRESQAFRAHWITHHDHRQAVELLTSRGKRALSLVDCTSFVLMRRLGVETALAFDEDFRGEGVRLYGDEPLPK